MLMLMFMLMACGRESRSAVAAAVPTHARRLHELVLVLVLFSVMPHGVLSQGLGLPPEADPSGGNTGRNMTCNSIPSPFGVRGRSIPGFEVTCGPNKEAMLPIGKHSYEIHDVSVQGGFVIIFAGAISQVCYDRNGTRMRTTGIDDITLEQTPFSNGADGDQLMILDWAVGRGTCNQNQDSTSNWAPLYCNNKSGCIDAPSGAGYLCKCNAVYEGNPYAEDGCVGSSVCTHPEKNPCTFPAFYRGDTCHCPPGMRGDGRKLGDGCQFPWGNLLDTPGITNFGYCLLFLFHSYYFDAIQLKQFYNNGAMVVC